MSNRGRGRAKHSWSRKSQQAAPAGRTWRRGCAQATLGGAGQTWDPFRPVQELLPAEVSGSASAASGISKAYARERSNKLVLQSRQSGAAPVEVPNAGQAHCLPKGGQSAPAPQTSGFLHQSSTVNAAAAGRPLSSSATGQAATSVLTGGSGAGAQCAQRPHGQALQSRQSVLRKQHQSGTARRLAKPHGKTWTRHSTSATVSHPGTPQSVQAVGPTQEHKSASSWGLQQRVQSLKFVLRRVNQLVRLSSLASQKSAAQQSWLGGSRSAVLIKQKPSRQFIRTPMAGAGRTAKADVLQKTAGVLTTGQSPTVLVRRGNKLVRVPRKDLPLSSQASRMGSGRRTSLYKEGATHARQQRPLHQRPAQLRRMGSQMYRVQNVFGRQVLQRTETPRRIPASAVQSQHSPLKVASAQVVRYVRRAGKLVRTLIPASPRVVAAAKAATAARLLTTAQLRRQPARVYMRPSPARATLAPSNLPALCPVFCRTGRCEGHRKGLCRLRHSAAWVAVCPKWLRGSCTTQGCTLQHAASPDVMPLCNFHMKGECSKKDCRYLHKQLPASATVCRAYAQGFCSRGSACMQKHLSPKMLRELRASRTLRAADCKVTASVSQPGSQAPDILPERLGASIDAEDGSKKRKWRYFWVEDEES